MLVFLNGNFNTRTRILTKKNCLLQGRTNDDVQSFTQVYKRERQVQCSQMPRIIKTLVSAKEKVLFPESYQNVSHFLL